MVAMCFKAVVHSGNFIPGSHIAKAFRRLISGKAQPIRLVKLCSPHSKASRAFLPLIISNRSTPKRKTSVSGLMSVEKTAAESTDLQSASPTKSSISGMEDKLLFLGGATSISVSWAWRASPNSPSLRDGRQIAFSGRRWHYCVLGMARKSKLPEPQAWKTNCFF
jgi:hypothetical protein